MLSDAEARGSGDPTHGHHGTEKVKGRADLLDGQYTAVATDDCGPHRHLVEHGIVGDGRTGWAQRPAEDEPGQGTLL